MEKRFDATKLEVLKIRSEWARAVFIVQLNLLHSEGIHPEQGVSLNNRRDPPKCILRSRTCNFHELTNKILKRTIVFFSKIVCIFD